MELQVTEVLDGEMVTSQLTRVVADPAAPEGQRGFEGRSEFC